MELLSWRGSDHPWSTKDQRAALAIEAKLKASEEKPKGVDPGPIEEALVRTARGKVIPLEGGYSMAGGLATAVKATEEQAELVGAYLARSGFFTGPFTVIDVLKKWHSWLPKARATQPPPALTPGLGARDEGHTGPGPGTPGPANPPGRTAPGFGRKAAEPRPDRLRGD